MNSYPESFEPVLIAGPTASGKSALALELAQNAGGVVINTDSMQVYRDLRVLTARPSLEEEARLPHRLYGHVDAAINFSAGAWVADAAKVLAEARTQNWLPIFVGGTGLYFKALTRGLSAVPPIPPEIRENVRARLERYRRDRNATVLLASHNMTEVERLCERVIIMKRGRIEDDDTPQRLLTRYGRRTLEEVFLDVARGRGELREAAQ